MEGLVPEFFLIFLRRKLLDLAMRCPLDNTSRVASGGSLGGRVIGLAFCQVLSNERGLPADSLATQDGRIPPVPRQLDTGYPNCCVLLTLFRSKQEGGDFGLGTGPCRSCQSKMN
jgi:hypothetical protein